MTENRFDAFTKYLAQAPSRRLVLKGLAAALAGIGLAALPRGGRSARRVPGEYRRVLRVLHGAVPSVPSGPG